MFGFLSLFILFVTSEIFAQRNDYLQFLTYSKNISHFNLNHWAEGFDECVDQGIHANRYGSISCMMELQRVNRERDPAINDHPHWISPSKHTLPNCHYEVKQIPTSPNTIFLHLRIRQHNCSNKSIHEAHPGGSSFYVLSEGLYQQACEVHDSRDHYYDIICFHQPLFMYRISPPAGAERVVHPIILESSDLTSYQDRGHYYHQQEWLRRHRYCQRITIILDYEHYDAFSEYGSYIATNYPLLRYPLLDRELFCVNDEDVISAVVSPLTLAILPMIASMLEDDALVSNEITNGCWRLKEAVLAILSGNDSKPVVYNFTSFDYEWKWETEFHNGGVYRPPFNLSTSIHALLSNHSQGFGPPLDYLFLGESHLRLIKDYLIGTVDPSELTKIADKQSHHSYQNLQFHFVPYNYNLKEALRDYCNAATTNITMITQTGAWDLAFSFLSQTLKYPKAAPDLLRLMKELILPDSIQETPKLWFEEALAELKVHYKHWLSIPSIDRNCQEHLQHLVWLDVMPYPNCQLREQKLEAAEVALCTQQKLGRNNYNIPALDYFYEQSLANLERVRQRQLFNDSHPNHHHPNHLSYFSEKHKKIHFLQTRKIFLPRMLSLNSMHGHYMDRKDFSASMKVTEEAVILVEALVRLLHFLK